MFFIDRFVKQDLVFHTILAIGIVLILGFLHEGLHYYQAIRLSYKPKWWRTKVRMGFEIEHDNSKQWQSDNKKIARLPYVVIIPISVFIFSFGLYFNVLGLMIAGIGTILLHGVSYPLEGK